MSPHYYLLVQNVGKFSRTFFVFELLSIMVIIGALAMTVFLNLLSYILFDNTITLKLISSYMFQKRAFCTSLNFSTLLAKSINMRQKLIFKNRQVNYLIGIIEHSVCVLLTAVADFIVAERESVKQNMLCIKAVQCSLACMFQFFFVLWWPLACFYQSGCPFVFFRYFSIAGLWCRNAGLPISKKLSRYSPERSLICLFPRSNPP